MVSPRAPCCDTAQACVVVWKQYSDDAMHTHEGEFFGTADFGCVFRETVDAYWTSTREQADALACVCACARDAHVLFRLRRAAIPDTLCALAIECYERPARVKNFHRGSSAGVLDLARLPAQVTGIVQTDRFRAKYYNRDNHMTNYQIGNMAQSNIVGFFEDTKLAHALDVNGQPLPPCRTTKFTKNNPEVWERSLPVVHHIDALFRETIPDRWHAQRDAARKTDFHIAGTSFSTITLNCNFRTACHKDRGDYEPGFGNIVVFTRGRSAGALLGFPQFGVAVDVQHGDYLAFDVHQWHCNTEMNISSDDRENLRLSLVLYYRKNIEKCQRRDITRTFYARESVDVPAGRTDARALYARLAQSRVVSARCTAPTIKSAETVLPSRYYSSVVHALVEKFDDGRRATRYAHVLSTDPLRLKSVNAEYAMRELQHLAATYSVDIELVVLLQTKTLLKIHIRNTA